MKHMSVKSYAELVGKSDKTIYKQIKKGSIESIRVKKGYRVCVDANMLKRLKKLEAALDASFERIKTMEKESHETCKKTDSKTAAPKKSATARNLKIVKKAAKSAQKSPKKP